MLMMECLRILDTKMYDDNSKIDKTSQFPSPFNSINITEICSSHDIHKAHLVLFRCPSKSRIHTLALILL
jgi:hypothetical protein